MSTRQPCKVWEERQIHYFVFPNTRWEDRLYEKYFWLGPVSFYFKGVSMFGSNQINEYCKLKHFFN